MEKHSFPKDAHIGDVKRPYEKLGQVRSKATYATLDPKHDETTLCRNYFNKAVEDLVRRAKKVGADAVIDVRSVTFYEMGGSDTFPRPECSDDGAEGEVLVEGIAVKWKPEPSPSPSPPAS